MASQEKLSHQLELQNLENQLQLVTTKLESVQAQSKSYQDDVRRQFLSQFFLFNRHSSMLHPVDETSMSIKAGHIRGTSEILMQ